jgi:hypothetical protein
MELGGVIRMGFLKKVVILLVLLSAIVLPISASGDMSGSGDDMSGSSPSSGGCYSDPMTGEITCVDAQGSPTGSTGSVPSSDTSSGTIIIHTSGGYSPGYYGGGSGGYTPPITTQRSFTWSNEPGVPQGPSWYENPYETGGKQAANTVGRAGLAYGGVYATAGAAAAAGAASASVAAALATAPAAAAIAAAATAVGPIVDAAAEWIKTRSAESEAKTAEEAAMMQSQKLKNRKMVQ